MSSISNRLSHHQETQCSGCEIQRDGAFHLASSWPREASEGSIHERIDAKARAAPVPAAAVSASDHRILRSLLGTLADFR
jgi:hypothetical protein